jgi:hypothetical protein
LIAALGGMLGLGLLCLALLWMLPNVNLNTRTELVLTIGAIFLFGCAISPAYYLPMSVFSINFGGRHCGLLIGLIDAFGYANGRNDEKRRNSLDIECWYKMCQSLNERPKNTERGKEVDN